MQLDLKPGSLIVFEGLDQSGKSKQAKMLVEACDHMPATIHMPSGFDGNTGLIYEALEDPDRRWSGGARQLLHLACHVESQPHLRRMLDRPQAVILDRWWWSTYAYGRGTIGTFTDSAWFDLCQQFWAGWRPDAVFLFTETYALDNKNRAAVWDGYRKFTEAAINRPHQVPRGEPWQVHEWIKAVLVANNLATVRKV